jgi:hypothetical protein
MVGEVGDELFARQATDFWPKLSNACCGCSRGERASQKKKKKRIDQKQAAHTPFFELLAAEPQIPLASSAGRRLAVVVFGRWWTLTG